MPEPLRLGVVGTGKLAGAVADLAALESIPATVLPSRAATGWRPDGIDVVLDCAVAESAWQVEEFCADHALPLVECVSGLDAAQLDRLERLSAKVTVVLAPNLTLGHYLQRRAMREIGRVLAAMRGAGIDAMPEASVLERHPATKRDRPSATARVLARTWERSVGPVAEIASVRAGGPVSDHSVTLCWPDQQLSLIHEVGSLQAAAAGALGLAEWARTGPQGLHDASDVFDELVSAWEDEQHHQGTPG